MTKTGTINMAVRPYEIEIDFDVVARTEDLDLLRQAVLEILDNLGKTDLPEVTIYFGPACDKLLEKRTEAAQ